jgi:ubiquitin-conjugating enzyme E2 R
MTFPDDYPFNPPTFRFNNEFYHPNGKFFCALSFYADMASNTLSLVYPDGRLCISILHPPGEDPISGEKAEVKQRIVF